MGVWSTAVLLFVLLCGCSRGELVKNAGFEAGMDTWFCWGFHCSVVTDKHSAHHALQVSGRANKNQGPSQYITVQGGKTYRASGYMKLVNDQTGPLSQDVSMHIEFSFHDGTKKYQEIASHPPITKADGWVKLQGEFTVPPQQPEKTRVYFHGPVPTVTFLVDDASVTELKLNHDDHTWHNVTNEVIRTHRMRNIRIQVYTAPHLITDDIEIQVLQTRKSFPFGSALNQGPVNDGNATKYHEFVKKHFNWGVPKNALKWPAVEPHPGRTHLPEALEMVHNMKKLGLKVRGHNLVWSKEIRIQDFVKALHGDALRREVKRHIQDMMNKTRGLLEHWDVNNENLHFRWYQDRLHDPDYDLELFRIAHHADPHVKLFLNDYDVVATGSFTEAYLAQARRFKAANVGLYGFGVQCHFPDELEPNPYLIKQRLDTLGQAGLPIWVTELDVSATDENKRADYYEKALRSFYGHPAVEGILFWGFWDQRHWRGIKAALAQGPNFELTAAGHRVFDLLENQWMTDKTRVLSQAGNPFYVHGYHGDYEVHVRYQGHERRDLKQTFTLAPGHDAHFVTIDMRH